jgi:hypothetical protein
MTCNHSIPDPSCDVCGLYAIPRNNYFDGKLITARHLEIESDFVRGIHRRHNSFLHGVGTVCGLFVHQHPDPNCQRQYVVVEPGLALDCCGHEIVVGERRMVDVAKLIADAMAEQGRKPNGLRQGENLTVRIQLAYRETGKDPVPALLDDCDTGNAEECDLIAEDYEVLVSAAINEIATPVENVLEPKLEWKQTLTVGLPQNAVVDRELERLYVAETDDQGGYLRIYHTQTHLLINRAQVLAAEEKDRGIKAIALSRGGGRIYLAVPPSADGTKTGSILVVERQKLENGSLADPLPALTLPASQSAIRLDVSVRDDALLALVVDPANGENAILYRWSAEQIEQLLNGTDASPIPADRSLTDLLRDALNDTGLPALRPVDMNQSIDGRWLILADNNPQGNPPTGRLVVISLPGFDSAVGSPADFINAFPLPSDRVVLAVGLSYDGSFLHALCRDQAGNSHLLRIKVDDTSLLSYIPHPADTDRYRPLRLILADDANAAPDTFEAVDLAVTPRDNFVYILRRRMNAGAQVARGDILIADVDRMDDGLVDTSQPELFKLTLRRGAALEDLVDFQVLSPLGGRLYAASHRSGTSEGMLRAYDIDEASCGTYFQNAIINGCDGCATTQPVTIASFQQFIFDAPMVNTDPGQGLFNLIDNFTHRETVPSTNTLREVIQCMLDKGFNEGVPGPRGDQGPTGNPGADGQPGQRGRGVIEARAQVGPLDADLEPIEPADPESDFRLVVTLPEVPGGAQLPSFNHVVAANFVHDEIFFDMEIFGKRVNIPTDERLFGLLIVFEHEVLARTLNNRTAQVLTNLRIERAFQPSVLVPMQVIPINFREEPPTESPEVAILNGYAFESETVPVLLMEEIIPIPVFGLDDPGEMARGVLLRPDPLRMPDLRTWISELMQQGDREVFPRDLDGRIKELPELLLISIVLRGNYILTKEGLELEATPADIHRRSGLPDPNATVPMGGDWVSFIHLAFSQDNL